MLTDQEVRDLDYLLVRDNNRVKVIDVRECYAGVGGTNRSTRLTKKAHRVKELANGPCLYCSFGDDLPGNNGLGAIVCIKAVVEDVVYVVAGSGVEHATMDAPFTRSRDGIAYDTNWYFSITPLEKERDW